MPCAPAELPASRLTRTTLTATGLAAARLAGTLVLTGLFILVLVMHLAGRTVFRIARARGSVRLLAALGA